MKLLLCQQDWSATLWVEGDLWLGAPRALPSDSTWSGQVKSGCGLGRPRVELLTPSESTWGQVRTGFVAPDKIAEPRKAERVGRSVTDSVIVSRGERCQRLETCEVGEADEAVSSSIGFDGKPRLILSPMIRFLAAVPELRRGQRDNFVRDDSILILVLSLPESSMGGGDTKKCSRSRGRRGDKSMLGSSLAGCSRVVRSSRL